jgi:hypothetical protein
VIKPSDRQILHRLWTDWVLVYRGRLGLIFLLMVVVALAGGIYPALISHVFDLLAGKTDSGAARFAFLSLPDDPFIAIPCPYHSCCFYQGGSNVFSGAERQ